MTSWPSCTPQPKLEEDCYDWYARVKERQSLVDSARYDILLMGDSITHFWETTLGPLTWKKLFGHRSVLNLGFGWDRTCNLLWRIGHGALRNQSPRLFVLNIGTNNFAATENYPGDDPEGVAQGIAEVVRRIRDALPETPILVMSIFQRGFNPSPFRKLVRMANARAKELLDGMEGVILLDISELFLLPDGSDLDASLFLEDGTHLNEAGYGRWAAALEAVFALQTPPL
ncbi:MAG: GDSL-type esterase/lipase family protein [Kiritimatiellia bacterium]|jgi:hypothetical protein